MAKQSGFLFFFILVLSFAGHSQKFSRTLLKADKLYIRKDFRDAVVYYEKYLKKNPRDFYASRQAAVCYGKMNNPAMAIDYWPAVIENGEATERDNLEYGKCLLANYRVEDARKVFIQLSRSNNRAIAAWGKAYMNNGQFFRDSALCKVTEVTGINTPGHEYGPVLLKDQLFFLSDVFLNLKIFNALSDRHLLEISSATRLDSTHFSAPVTFRESQARNVNGPFCFSPDGATIYISTAVHSKNLGVKGKAPYYRFQLYTAPATSGGEPQAFKYNSPDYDVMHPNLSSDGQHLYFASDMKGSLGGKDIFMCELMNGEWGAPVNLGPEVNTSGNEVFPYMSEEGLLYFVSDTRPGLGGLDIFAAKPGGNGKLFQDAKNVGAPINTQFDDFGLFLLPGGKTGYLSSNRKNNTDDDIYYFRNDKPEK